jgi:nucleoside-diphosphate-sugar epimerase
VITVAVIGAEGFVGSAFAEHLATHPGVSLRKITRQNYAAESGQPSDVVVDCSANSRKYLAEERPVEDFDLSVTQRLRTLHAFPARQHLHVSSVDVYGHLESEQTTREDSPMDAESASHYGFHKLLAESLVRHYAARWLIVRLAGMVGPGLRKNPVYDVLEGSPQRIHPDSLYQFLDTRDVAKLCWSLVENGSEGIFNVCGEGVVSPREIARMADRRLDLSFLPGDAVPRVVRANIDKLRGRLPIPKTMDTVAAFVQSRLTDRKA